MLASAGPKMPRRLVVSDEGEVVVNPALSLVMQTQLGIELPDASVLLDLVDSADASEILDRFRSVGMPKEWAVREFATLTIFKFAKEAMYRDLLDNEDDVAASPLVQALSGAIPAERSRYLFEPHDDSDIDVVAPPEENPLILDADSSQRAAVVAALEGKSFVLDGPPGTGKSQTIANMIAALIGKGKKVLFVSEKIVALEVVEKRLAEVGLEPFLFVLHSSKSSRKEVAKHLGEALEQRPRSAAGMEQFEIAQLQAARQELSAYSQATAKTRRPLLASYYSILGQLEKTGFADTVAPFDGRVEELTPSRLGEIEDSGSRLAGVWSMALRGKNALWYGLQDSAGIDLNLEELEAALAALEPAGEVLEDLLRSAGRESINALVPAWSLVERWRSSSEFTGEHWLREMGLSSGAERLEISTLVADYGRETAFARSATRELESCVGAGWRELPIVEASTAEDCASAIDMSAHLDRSMTTSALREVHDRLVGAQTSIVSLKDSSDRLAEILGVAGASTVEDAAELVDMAFLLTGNEAPFAEWLTTNVDLSLRREAFNGAQEAELARDVAREAGLVHFLEGTPEQNLNELQLLVVDNRSVVKIFSSGRREMKTRLALISQEKWKVAAEHLPEAISWKAAADAYASALSRARNLLPEHARAWLEVERPNWENLSARVENTQRLREGLRIIDPPRLSALEQGGIAFGEVRHRTAELKKALTEWHTSCEGLNLPASCEPVALDETRDFLSVECSRAESVCTFVDEQEAAGPAHETLADYIRCADLRRKVRDASESSNEIRRRLGNLVPLPEPAEDLWNDAEAITERHAWNEGTLVSLSELVGPKGVVSETLIRSLESAPPSPNPTDLVNRARNHALEFLNRFDESRRSDLAEDFETVVSAQNAVTDFRDGLSQIDEWEKLRSVSDDIRRFGLERAQRIAIDKRLEASEIERYLLAATLKAWLGRQVKTDSALQPAKLGDMDKVAERFRKLDAQLPRSAAHDVIEACASRRPRRVNGQATIIRHEAMKKRRHIPVRELVSKAHEAIFAVHPCFMMSPLAVSQYLPSDIRFDVVIFDEASQVMPGDAVNCVYRANALIAAGDQKQLPPTLFFGTVSSGDDEEEEENVATDFESLLDLMKSCGNFTSQSLNWHYRSRHESLIAFSNASFYESGLVTYPGAIERSDDLGVKFFKVDGVYDRAGSRRNVREAKFVVDRILYHVRKDPKVSLGVVAFSKAQSEAVETQLELAKMDHPELADLMTPDRQSGLFIKNLESVQGDERDIIIFSIGYGPDGQGLVYKNFGPVGMKGGERRLNVAVTRARKLVEVVSSMTAGQIQDPASAGARHLKRYLDYAERGQIALESESSVLGMGPESPFEESVIDFVKSLGYDVETQVGVSGYRIDVGVRHPNFPGAFMMGIECDGAMYHSSRSTRDRDRLRHDVLTGLGWNLYHVWGTDWYRNRSNAKRQLQDSLSRAASRPVTGTLTRLENVVTITPPTKREDVEEFGHASWAVPYPKKTYSVRSSIDFSDPDQAFRLVSFVTEVARNEAPLHIDTLAQRLKESSWLDRVGSRIKRTLEGAIEQADVVFDGEFIRLRDSRPLQVRQPRGGSVRKVGQVPPEEIELCLELLARDSIGLTREEMIKECAQIFGWKRLGPDINRSLDAAIDRLIRTGELLSADGTLTSKTPHTA
jgi:very-short-patch-repair endonuclease